MKKLEEKKKHYKPSLMIQMLDDSKKSKQDENKKDIKTQHKLNLILKKQIPKN